MQKNLNLLLRVVFSLVTTLFYANYVIASTPLVHLSAKPSWILPSKKYNNAPSARDIDNGAYDEFVEEQQPTLRRQSMIGASTRADLLALG